MAEIGKIASQRKRLREALSKLSKEEKENMTEREMIDYIIRETGDVYYTHEEFWERAKEKVRQAYGKDNNV